MSNVTSHDIAWVAGIFEGEGSCGPSARNTTCQEVVVIQKDRWLLDRLVSMFGGSICNKKAGAFGGSGCARWKLTGPRARAFLTSIYSYLSPRRKAQVARIGVFDALQIGVS